MPLYDYDCLACGRRIEVVHGVYSPGPTHCPNCGGGPLKKAITAAAVHFKGTGWAKRDRRVTVGPGPAKTSTEAAPAAEAGKEGGSTSDTSTTAGGGTADAGAGQRSTASPKASEPANATKAD
jgi:putative FmdB family regulatory protein